MVVNQPILWRKERAGLPLRIKQCCSGSQVAENVDLPRSRETAVGATTSSAKQEGQINALHTSLLVSWANRKASSWNCSLSSCILDWNLERELVSLESIRHLEGKLSPPLAGQVIFVGGGGGGNLKAQPTHPWLSINAYLGTESMLGAKVATQVSINTRRGTWLAWITEASMLMRSPRKNTLDVLSSCQSSRVCGKRSWSMKS